MLARHTPFIVLAAALLLTAGLVRIAAADNTSAPPPTRLATINIVHVFDALNEKVAGDSEIEQLNKDLTDQRRKIEESIEKIKGEMKDYKAESPEFKDASERLLKKGMEVETFARFQQQKLLLERRIKTASLYRRINAAVEQYSKANGIALVLVTDDADIAGARTTEELLSRITIRKVIYAHESLDISDKIIEKMNTEYKLPK